MYVEVEFSGLIAIVYLKPQDKIEFLWKFNNKHFAEIYYIQTILWAALIYSDNREVYWRNEGQRSFEEAAIENMEKILDNVMVPWSSALDVSKVVCMDQKMHFQQAQI